MNQATLHPLSAPQEYTGSTPSCPHTQARCPAPPPLMPFFSFTVDSKAVTAHSSFHLQRVNVLVGVNIFVLIVLLPIYIITLNTIVWTYVNTDCSHNPLKQLLCVHYSLHKTFTESGNILNRPIQKSNSSRFQNLTVYVPLQ